MLIKTKIGYLLHGRAIADAERKTSQNGKDYVSIPLRVDSRLAPEGSKYKHEGDIINLSCWRDLADAALCIQKGMVQTDSNAAPMTPTDIPTPFDAAPEADLSAPLDDEDDLPF